MPRADIKARQSPLVVVRPHCASDRQIAAVLGHATLKMVQVYVKHAEQRVLARDAQHKRDAMYDADVLEAAIDAAGNVRRLRSA